MLLLDVVLAILALLSLCAALLHVIDPYFNFEFKIAPRALFWPHITIFFVVAELCPRHGVWTVLTFYGLVSGFLMLLSFGFGNNLAAFLALVVVTGTSDFVHAELTYFDCSITCWTNLCLLLLCRIHHFRVNY